MKTLYIDCGSGMAGDMLAGALLDLFPDTDSLITKLNQLGIPGVTYRTKKMNDIAGICLKAEINESLEETEHVHAGKSHNHQTLAGIEHIVNDHLTAPDQIKKQILNVYKMIAKAESEVHGVEVNKIHLHEVGSIDAIADIAAVSFLMDLIKPDVVIASPVHVGRGTVKCLHGILPVPSPATACLLKGIPMYSRDDVEGELCTPTGAALLKAFVNTFEDMPLMTVNQIGYGSGTKDFGLACGVRAFLGEKRETASALYELRFNVDDMSGEEIAYAQNIMMESGAADVFLTSVQMKKGRPGTLFTVLTTEKNKETVVRTIFKHTTTLGIREFKCGRYIMNREVKEIDTSLGTVRRKDAWGYETQRYKYEYEDLSAIARKEDMSIEEVIKQIEKQK